MKLHFIFLNVLILSLIFSCSVSRKIDNDRIGNAEFSQARVPLFMERANKELMTVTFDVASDDKPVTLKSVEVKLREGYDMSGIASFTVHHSASASSGQMEVIGNTSLRRGAARLATKKDLKPGTHLFQFDAVLNENPDMLSRFQVEKLTLHFTNHKKVELEPGSGFTYRIANVVRAAGQDNCDTYRIPGMVTTNSGTLMAVYDNRYNNSKDLQEDIDVGLSRSTDGGQTWEPMRVIMDMGEWGGRPERLNGIGDPAVLYDHTRNTIWVAGLWVSGFSEKDMLWWTSQPGMRPDETGQFVLVKSTDDGLTWSDPINITGHIKDPQWQLMFQGPGMGITLDDGTLVFPAQFKADIGEKALDGGQYTAHSTLVYSKDNGETWHIGTGAKPNTTEAQVVQLTDGSLMLNMRDDLNRKVKDKTNGRAVAVTSDFGQSWTVHPSSNSALPEPNCMASIISAGMDLQGLKQRVLLFSNPADKHSRINLTIKASFDEGHTWPEEYHVLLNENQGFGYSCLTMADEHTVGILYEGVKELYFQKIPLNEILRK